jgi:dipeptidyl aminopeptidase/acylaminoacyl peptidase
MEIPHAKPTLFSSQIKGLGLYPVVIMNHDITPNKPYDTVTSDATLVDYFARKGFLVIKPDYRGVGNSEADPTSLAPLPYSADVLNLISSLKTIPEADTMNVFLWGQRLGGEVALKTLEVAGDNADATIKNAVKGAVVWSPSIDPSQWGNDRTMYDGIVQNFGSPSMNPLFWQSISVKNYLDDIKAPIEIDQGTADNIISYTSSIELYNDLVSFNKNAKLRLFSNDTHNFSKYRTTVLDGNVTFFKKLISPSK